MKRARPALSNEALTEHDAFLTTGDVARLLRVHPKHVYRLLKRGLPGHRVGGEWRFFAVEVLRWSGARTRLVREGGPSPDDSRAAAVLPPPLLAANGDIAIERLLSRGAAEASERVGLVQADSGESLVLLGRGAVLAAGHHGGEVPPALHGHRLAFIHLVERRVGLALRRGVRVPSLRDLTRRRLASRPETAGVRTHFDAELRRQGIDPEALHANAALLPSHREVVCALARGEVDVGLASAAWSQKVGLDFSPLCSEAYGLLVRATSLGDPRIIRLCEIAQSSEFRRDLEEVAGYDARHAGVISYPALAGLCSPPSPNPSDIGSIPMTDAGSIETS